MAANRRMDIEMKRDRQCVPWGEHSRWVASTAVGGATGSLFTIQSERGSLAGGAVGFALDISPDLV